MQVEILPPKGTFSHLWMKLKRSAKLNVTPIPLPVSSSGNFYTFLQFLYISSIFDWSLIYIFSAFICTYI